MNYIPKFSVFGLFPRICGVQVRAVDASTLRDPQTDEERVKEPEWLVILGKSSFVRRSSVILDNMVGHTLGWSSLASNP